MGFFVVPDIASGLVEISDRPRGPVARRRVVRMVLLRGQQKHTFGHVPLGCLHAGTVGDQLLCVHS